MCSSMTLACAVCVGLLLAGAGCEREGEERGPTISVWAARPHADRGVCTRCHQRVDRRGLPVPAITSASRMPHMDRGVCSNCHRITRGADGPRGRLVGMERGVPLTGPRASGQAPASF